MNNPVRILIGDVLDGLRSLPDGSVQCCVTSPPYYQLRDYGIDGQIGLEPTPEAFVAKMVEVFAEVRRVLRKDGVCFLNIGDSYAKEGVSGLGLHTETSTTGKPNPYATVRKSIPSGLKPKDLCMIPWRVALALQADGWYLRSVIVWAKKSPMPESVTDRPTSSWEPIFLLAKSERYFYDHFAVREPLERGDAGSRFDSERKLTIHPTTGTNRMPPIGGVEHAGSNGNATYSGDRPEWPDGRNQRNVWHLGPEPLKELHFAAFPSEIPRRAILAGTSEKGACPDCGAPWRRVVDVSRTITSDSPRYAGCVVGDGSPRNSDTPRKQAATRTTGWEPTCKCGNPNTVPCVVLDPFLGSGTTIAVARTLGRHGVGCELNPTYAELARDRIGKAEKPSTYVAEKADDSPLFAGDPK